MEQFNVHEAKTNFSKLLERVQAGEQILIARNGEPIATLSPIARTKFRSGMGTGEFVNRERLKDLAAYAPMTDEEADDWAHGR